MNGDRLKRAREIKGLTQSELAEAVGVSQAAIARIEQNLFEPSEHLVQQIALKTGFPVSFFYLDTGTDFPLGSLLYRKHASLKSRERAQIVQMAWAAYQLFEHMAQRLRMMPFRLPRLENEDIASAALLARNALGIEPELPARNLIHKLEKSGVVILSLPLEIHEHDAFSLWVEQRRPIIAFSGGKSGDRQRRSAAHELGHLVLHHVWPTDQDRAEKEADAFASEFLLPEEVMRREIIKPVTLSSLAELKPRWGVAIQALIERAYELEIITIDQRRYLWKQISVKGWNLIEPLYIEPEKPRAIRRMAELLYGNKDGSINHQKLARDTSMPASLVGDILDCYSDYQPSQQTTPSAQAKSGVIDFPKKTETGTKEKPGTIRNRAK